MLHRSYSLVLSSSKDGRIRKEGVRELDRCAASRNSKGYIALLADIEADNPSGDILISTSEPGPGSGVGLLRNIATIAVSFVIAFNERSIMTSFHGRLRGDRALSNGRRIIRCCNVRSQQSSS